MRLPDEAGTVHISAASADLLASTAAATQRAVAVARWHDANNQLCRSQELMLHPASNDNNAGPATASFDVRGGWIEIIGSERVAVELSWEDATSNIPATLTPEPTSNKMYLCDNETLRFPLHHLADNGTPLRLSARQLVKVPQAAIASATTVQSRESHAEPASILWQFLDDNDQELRAGELLLTPTASQFDMTDRPDPAEDVSDDVQLYFQVPLHARQLRIHPQSGRSLVHVATRPVGLPVKKFVSDGVGDDEWLTHLPVRAWFPVRAVELRQQATALLLDRHGLLHPSRRQ